MKITIEVKDVTHPTDPDKHGLACRLLVDNEICTVNETQFARFLCSKLEGLQREFVEWADNPDAKDFEPHGGFERIREIGEG